MAILTGQFLCPATQQCDGWRSIVGRPAVPPTVNQTIIHRWVIGTN
jgi:hypothetical protein